jgi:NAD(P)-dependent dehydrogenase (short-subunit alcohol dehydrogenase family)
MQNSMQGKTVIVTGGTNGIGLVTARELARLGAQETIISRSAEKCATVAASIQSETDNPVEFIAADLSTLAGIMHAAAVFKQRHTRLHVLVNNAGGFFMRRTLTEDGNETTFALNHLNYFLLTILLLDLLKASAPARIINVASGSHLKAAIDFDDLHGEKHYTGMGAYGQSKLANVLFTYELARRLEGSGVTVNAMHPGFTGTGIGKNNGFIVALALRVAHLFSRKPEEGAQTCVYLASSPEVEGVTGKYYFDCKPEDSSPLSHDQALAEKLWQVSLEMTDKVAQDFFR